jgi:aspartate aminotransferase-like enzyme/GNAT superfamily N-acetyltransferase
MSVPLHPVRFKLATEPGEIEQIHRFNYRTFVDEIPQHAPNPDGRLVDRFHDENTYVIGVSDGRVVAMLALRGNRPFSLDSKLPDLDGHLPPGRRVVEIRLLAIDPERRRGPVFHALLHFAAEQCLARGYDLAIISGTTRQLKLYRHLGFKPFGPLVGTDGAQFQPMFLTLEGFVERARTGHSLRMFARAIPSHQPLNFLPGPVAMSPAVVAAFSRPPESHRGRAFLDDLMALRARLSRFVNATSVQVLPGSGSLGTDCVGAQLSLLGGRGVILSNGEFGERLASHARGFALDFAHVCAEWGHVFSRTEIESALEGEPHARWLWAVHHETSSGVLNDLAMLRDLCAARGIRLCLDCISSIGVVPVDLAGVWLATGVSGKGLGAYAGLALAFYSELLANPIGRVPRYLDLAHWESADGVPFTHSSNLVRALEAAMTEAEIEGAGRFVRIAQLADELRGGFRNLGFEMVAPEAHACPAIVTVAMREPGAAMRLGEQLERAGFLLSYRSQYLVDRNWIQACLMGAVTEGDVAALLDTIAGTASPVRGLRALARVPTRAAIA